MTPTVADEHNKEELDDVRQKYFEASEEIKVLLRKRIVSDLSGLSFGFSSN